MTDLELGYEEGRAVTRREAKNFYYAILTLPAAQRRAICVAYAFCRYCDDAVDAETSTEEKLSRLAQLQRSLDGAYSGESDTSLSLALADVARTYDVPQEYFHELLRGMERDLVQYRYRDFEDLREYCYQVASVVGLICLQIFGYKDPGAKAHAIDLGIAMQLTNIARDVGEDLEFGRIYLPQDEIARFGYSEEEMRQGIVNEAFFNLMTFQAQRARSYFKSGFKLLPYLPPRTRACPAVLGQVYSKLLEHIEASGFDVLHRRISLTTPVKVRVLAQTWLTTILPLGNR